MNVKEWMFSIDHKQLCQIIETQTLWNITICRIWLPGRDTVVRIPASQLKPLDEIHTGTAENIAYIAVASRIADALTQDILLSPIESSVIPLPHQIQALSRSMSSDRVRYLLADEVGLGKTIEAGLIMSELKLRGLIKRILVIAPRGLVSQWIAEMQTHFDEEFHLLAPSDFGAYRRITNENNPWRSYDQVVCPMDSVKPLDKRQGWSLRQISEYNRERFENLITAGWDLVIVDEAHRMGGSTEQVARYKLGRGLAEAAPYLLLLSATPHQGKSDAFHRLISLLDREAFPDMESIAKDRIYPYVIRTEKRRAIDAQGKPLFKPRRTQLIPISWGESHRTQQILYDAVTEYVRKGYNQAIREKKSYIGFLMILMQRLVTSSTRAIRTSLEKRLEVLQKPDIQLSLFPEYTEEEWVDLDGQEQMEMLLHSQFRAIKNERAEVKALLETAKDTETEGPDAKAEALLSWIYRLQQEEGDPDLKILVFTEFVPTQQMLKKFLVDRGFSVACLNGSMNMEERLRAQDEFAGETRILVSTNAGGEGLNLQFCHVVINYDIPWNPMRLEQRIGRVDRIGQEHIVQAINFVFENTVEYRVREVLEEKLAVILEEFGVDKTGDVLDSAQAGQIFDKLYIESILDPDILETKVGTVVNQVQDQARAAHESISIFGESKELDPQDAQKLIAHPMPHWVERMAVSYLNAHGGKAERNDGVWNLIWPDGEHLQGVVFTMQDAKLHPSARHLTLEDHRIRGLAMQPPRFAPGQPISCIVLPGLPKNVKGIWSLWRIVLHTAEWNKQRVIPLFVHDDGRTLLPTARSIWDQLLSNSPDIVAHIEEEKAYSAFECAQETAETHGKSIYDKLVQENRKRLSREQEKKELSFAARRRAIERIGLPTVRRHRLEELTKEEQAWREEFNKGKETYPEIIPLIMLRVDGKKSNG